MPRRSITAPPYCLTDNHARQEQAFEALGTYYNKGPDQIRRLLTEKSIAAGDDRALFIGIDTYLAEGGAMVCAVAGQGLRCERLDRSQMGASLSQRGPASSQASCWRTAIAIGPVPGLAEGEGRATTRYYAERALHGTFEARRKDQQKRCVAFSAAYGVHVQKKRFWPANSSARTWPRRASFGAKARLALIRKS